jgi:hypothetical protein
LDIFSEERSRWVPALPYRRKPTWYGKRVSDIFCFGVLFKCYGVFVFRTVTATSKKQLGLLHCRLKLELKMDYNAETVSIEL